MTWSSVPTMPSYGRKSSPRVLGLPEKEAKQTLSRYFRTDFQQEYARYVAGMVHALAVRLPQKLSYS